MALSCMGLPGLCLGLGRKAGIFRTPNRLLNDKSLNTADKKRTATLLAYVVLFKSVLLLHGVLGHGQGSY